MALDRTWLLGTARAEREALGRSIQYTEPAAWDRPSLSHGWRTRDIVAHLASSDSAAADAVAGEPAAELLEFSREAPGGTFTLDDFNAYGVRQRADLPFRQVVKEWGHAADLFLSRASSIRADEWSTRKVMWVAGEIGAAYLVQSRIMEWWLHGEDIRAGGDNPPRFEHPPIYVVNDLAIRMLPYALGLAGLSFPGRSVEVELEGIGGGRWHRGLAAREVPAPGKRPDAVITGRAEAFALVAGRRVPAEHYLADGTLLTGGDDALAEAVLANVRAFAG